MVTITKTVRFYRLMLQHPRVEDSVPLEQSAVDKLVDIISSKAVEDRTHSWKGKTFEGMALDHSSGYRGKYLYVGRIRQPHALPDELASGVPTSLAHNPSVHKVSEPCYVLPTGIDASLALLTTQQSAKDTDIAFWLTQCFGFDEPGYSLELVPLVNTSQLELLENAEFVTKVEAQRTPEQLSHSGNSGDGDIEEAFTALGQMGGGVATAYIKTSLGRSDPDTLAGEEFTREAKQFLGSGQYDKAVATLKSHDPEHADRLLTEHVNFVRELITHQVRFKAEGDQPTEANQVVPEMAKAVRENAEYLSIVGRSLDESSHS